MKREGTSLLRERFKLILPFIGLAILLTVFSIKASDTFPTTDNLVNVVRRTAPITVAAVGMTFVIISGGIDLSVGSVIAFSGYCGALAMVSTKSIAVGIAVSILAGAGCGLINGFFITVVGIAPFIVTLGMMSAVRGTVLIMKRAEPVTEGIPAGFTDLANGTVAGVPIPIIITLLVLCAGAFVLHWTPLGRYTYAIGSNREAAFHSGVPIVATLLAIYVMAGALTGLSGILVVSELNSAHPTSAEGAELTVIAGVVIGGTSLMGGEGGVLGTVVGTTFMAVLENGCRMASISPHWQKVALGLAIVLAAGIDVFARKGFSWGFLKRLLPESKSSRSAPTEQ